MFRLFPLKSFLIVELKSTFDILQESEAHQPRDQVIIQLELLNQLGKQELLVCILCDGIAFGFIFRFRPKDTANARYFYTKRFVLSTDIIPLLTLIKINVIDNYSPKSSFNEIKQYFQSSTYKKILIF
jgi:hypothetical protein